MDTVCILIIDDDAESQSALRQVLDSEDRPIIGLYGAGNCIGSTAGQGYWAGGSTLGPALTFGALAGRHAAASSPKELT